MANSNQERRSIVVVAAVITRGGRVLLARRQAGRSHAGLWEFPGGKVEPGEDERLALARELHEELGLLAEVGAFVAASNHTEGHTTIVLRAYQVAAPGEPTHLTDHDQLAWVPLAELVAYPMPPADLPIVHALQAAARREATTPEN